MHPQLCISKVSNILEDSALVYFLEFPKNRPFSRSLQPNYLALLMQEEKSMRQSVTNIFQQPATFLITALKGQPAARTCSLTLQLDS